MNIGFRTSRVLVPVLLSAITSTACGDHDDVTARNPLHSPVFSIDRDSVEVQAGILSAADLLLPSAGPTYPDVVVPAENMSLFSPLDDLDALSLLAWDGGPDAQFTILLSVDRAAVGAVPPDPGLVSMGMPFNVQEQAIKNQAAGDAFMSLLVYTRVGPIPTSRGSYAYNNTLVLNQGDAGGVHFQVNPARVSPSNTILPEEESNVDAAAGALPRGRLLDGPSTFDEVLFSLTADSPSLATLPGTGSGADIYVDRNLLQAGGEELYLAHLALGLQWADDIDAMIVIDADDPFLFNPENDQVIFSLAPGSPSLAAPFGPGDLFVSTDTGTFEPYCPANNLGLYSSDNVNLLDSVVCDDVLPSVHQWGIGFVYGPCIGDVDGDRDVDITDLALLLASYGLCDGDPGFVSAADFNETGCVELSDLAALLGNYGHTCPPLYRKRVLDRLN